MEHSAENGPPVPLPIGTVIRLNTDPGDEWDAMPNRNYIITAHEKATGDAFEVPSDFGHGVEFYGRRENGVGFGGTLRLTGLWRTDD